MSGLKQGSMRLLFNNIYMKLINDEELMRLMYYKPQDYSLGRLHPLDKTLPDIVTDEPEYWDIVDNHVVRGTKTTEIQEKGICRLYLYAGRRRPRFGNRLMADQEVMIDVLVHELFDKDDRLNWIWDRLNELLIHERLAGYGQVDLVAGNPRVAPIGYSKYELTYKFIENKK